MLSSQLSATSVSLSSDRIFFRLLTDHGWHKLIFYLKTGLTDQR